MDAAAFYALKSECLGGNAPLEFGSLKNCVVLVTNVASY